MTATRKFWTFLDGPAAGAGVMARIVEVVPVGATARSLVKEAAEPVVGTYGMDVVVGNAVSEPAYAYNKDRHQYHSTPILRRLCAAKAKNHAAIVGVAEVDLFVPDAPFVLGEADRESRSAVVSLARLRPEFMGEQQDNDRVRARGRAELAHAVGHLLGLSHCSNPHCVMLFSRSVADSDRKGCELCNDCRADLARTLREW